VSNGALQSGTATKWGEDKKMHLLCR